MLYAMEDPFLGEVMATKAKVYTATTEKLREVAKEVDATIDVGGLSRTKLLLILEGHLRDLEKHEEREALLSGLISILAAPVPTTTTGVDTEVTVTSAKSTTEHGDTCTSSSSYSMWKKDFKISGQIGDPKTEISFSSLDRQVEMALKKGYKEVEVMEAIISAIQPGANLRSYLEGRTDLTLLIVRKILQSHYKEPPVTDLYKKLCNITQGSHEDAMDFVTRALDLKQRVISSSKATSDFTYDEELVHRMFLHAVETGLRDEVLRQQLRGVLSPTATDLDILQALNKIILVEAEHCSKVKRVNTVELVGEMKALRCDVNSLKLPPGESGPDKRQAKKQPKKRCVQCEGMNADNCQHCFKCGSDTHFSRGCRVHLNAQRSLSTGNQRP